MKTLPTSVAFSFLLSLVVIGLSGCDDQQAEEGLPGEELTENITFSGGSVRQGSPPPATNKPGDPVVSGAPSNTATIQPGGQGSLAISYSSVPANTPFDVNVRFSGSNSYIRIPVSPAVTGGATSGNLNIPFSLSQQVCSSLDDINHQITCYESVNVGGTRVSREQARQMVLACQGGGDDTPGEGSFCAYNYPEEACNLVRSNFASIDSNIRVNFVAGSGASACAARGLTGDEAVDYGFTSSDGVGRVGACIVAFPTYSKAGMGKIDSLRKTIDASRLRVIAVVEDE